MENNDINQIRNRKSGKTGKLTQDQLELINQIYRGNERLLILVRDLLDLAKLQEGREAFQTEYGEGVTKLFDRVHGSAIYGADGIGAKLSGEGKSTTRIWMLNSEYIKQTLKTKGDGTMIARASCLYYFDNHSGVSLSGRILDLRKHVRGVAKETAEGGAQEIDYAGIGSQLSTPGFDHKQLSATLTPVSANRLALVLADYVGSQKQ